MLSVLRVWPRGEVRPVRRGQAKLTREQTTRDLAAAAQSLASARESREEQERLRAREQETVMDRFERLSAGNHLAELLLHALSGTHGRAEL